MGALVTNPRVRPVISRAPCPIETRHSSANMLALPMACPLLSHARAVVLNLRDTGPCLIFWRCLRVSKTAIPVFGQNGDTNLVREPLSVTSKEELRTRKHEDSDLDRFFAGTCSCALGVFAAMPSSPRCGGRVSPARFMFAAGLAEARDRIIEVAPRPGVDHSEPLWTGKALDRFLEPRRRARQAAWAKAAAGQPEKPKRPGEGATTHPAQPQTSWRCVLRRGLVNFRRFLPANMDRDHHGRGPMLGRGDS